VVATSVVVSSYYKLQHRTCQNICIILWANQRVLFFTIAPWLSEENLDLKWWVPRSVKQSATFTVGMSRVHPHQQQIFSWAQNACIEIKALIINFQKSLLDQSFLRFYSLDVRKFCEKRIYKKIPGQKKFCGDSSDAFVLYQWAKNKKSHSIHKQLGTSNSFRKEKLSSNFCKRSEGGEENNNAGSRKRQPRSRAPAADMEFAERKKKPKTTSK